MTDDPITPLPPGPPGYPVLVDIDEPTGSRNRLTAAFRLILVIPIAVVLGAINGAGRWDGQGGSGLAAAGGLLFAAPLLTILFRKKYPRWWFDWNLELLRFHNRVAVYLLLLRDEYPSTDSQQAVRLDLQYPDAQVELLRGMPLIKWILAIPHYVVLIVLYLGAIVAAVVSWFSIVITGRLPRGLFDYQVGVIRWTDRVAAYAIILTTDAYPPFRLGA
jgi:Domain of unknown function (DUF4389)